MDQGNEPVMLATMDYLETNIVVESGQYRQIVLSDDTEHLQANEEHCDIVVKENASLEMYRIQNLDDTTNLKTHIHIHQERDSRVHFVVISFNAGDLRNIITVDVDGEGCETLVYGLYLVDKKQHVENYLKINHNMAHCMSDTRFKGIMDDEAMANFHGHILVAPDSQRTAAFQTNKNLLLTDKAHVTTKPFLEIYADDVQCSHGATVGQLDEEALYYLRTRGIGEAAANRLLMFAFANEIVQNVAIEALRDRLSNMVQHRLHGELNVCAQCMLNNNIVFPISLEE